jgi:mono/diheme cytochrome c family protein
MSGNPRLFSRFASRFIPVIAALSVAASASRLAAQNIDFRTQIQPIFSASCVKCHSGASAGGGLSLDSAAALARGGASGAAVTAGDPARSLLYQRITATDAQSRMPMGGPALPAQSVALIRAWIEQGAPGLPIAPAAAVDFVRDVRPIFQANCYACHSGSQPKSQLRLDQKAAAMKGGASGPVIAPGNSRDSRLIHRVLGMDGAARMPFGRPPLAEKEIAVLKAWIDQGARWPDSAASDEQGVKKHWAYVKPVRPAVPAVHSRAWVRNPIDAFILARLEKEGLKPSPEASRETLIRRLSLDLIGLPPSPKEIDAFVNDPRPDAYERLVDRLLANPHYGERWARPWLDLARYADTNGYEKDRRRSIWKYRDWVIHALNEDMPYDEFTIEQLAGDLLPHPSTDQIIATGFNRNTLFNEEGGVDKNEEHWTQLLDRVNTTATVWLGTTLACAQCHNHKFDPFTQKEYYQFLAFFNNSDYKEKDYGDTSHKYIEPQLDLPTPEQAARRDELKLRIDALERKLKTQTPELDAEQRAWEQKMKSLEASWRPLGNASARSLMGAKLERQSDGSWLATGDNPATDTYVIEGRLPQAASITGLRIEALPDASLPRGGPGRDVYGNFALTEVRIELVTDAGAAKPLAISAIKADNGRIKSEKDKPDASLWTVDATREDQRLRRQLILAFNQPVPPQSGAIRVTMVHRSEFSGQGIGRFRVSATSAAEPETAAQAPAALRPVLELSPGLRTQEQAQDLAKAFREVAPSLKATRDELKKLQKELDALGIITTLVMRDRTTAEPLSAVVRVRGSFLSPGETVYAGTPAVLNPWPQELPKNRLGLAEWLVSKDNPLTARVAVNRIWEQYFGHGIVETSEDFGTQGERPSHPELLDWLAVEFMERGWSQKAIHRLIVTSSTYRQDSRVTPELEERDPYNRLLARGPRFRVEAEMVRDIALSASGLLSPKIGGPSVFPYQPDGIWDLPYNDDKWVMSKGEDRYRRGLYTFVRRTSPYPSMTVFDAPSREVCTVRRVRTNTPLQALTMLNDPVFVDAAQALARRVLKEAGPAPADRATLAFRLCTGRRPQAVELDAILKSYEQQRKHFEADPSGAERLAGGTAAGSNAADAAAWTMISNSLLNLDETVTKE